MLRVGLPAQLYQRVQAGLSRCSSFDSDRALRALCVDARVARWRDRLPEMTENRTERVRAVIGALIEQFDERGKNALVLLLAVLAENTPPGDILRSELMLLAQEAAILETGEPDAIGGQNANNSGSLLVTATPDVDTSALRKHLRRLDDVQFEALCLDHYPKVYARFSRGLRYEEKLTLLLNHIRNNPEEAVRLPQRVNDYE